MYHSTSTIKLDLKRVATVVFVAVLLAMCMFVYASCNFASVSLSSISAVYSGGEVEVGGKVDRNDITVVANYSNKTSKTVTSYELNYDFSVAGQRLVTVTYAESGQSRDASFRVEVVEKTIVSPDPQPPAKILQRITASYSGNAIKVGGAVNKSDIAVTAYYDNESSATVQDFQISNLDSSTAGQKSITVTYTENDVTCNCALVITVVENYPPVVDPEPVVTLERIAAVYTGRNIKVGGALNNADITVTAYYSDDSSHTVTNFAVGGFSSAKAGVCAVTVSYGENGIIRECAVNITIVDDSSTVSENNLSIHFLELGNNQTGDSVYIKAGDTDILIDAGSNKSSAPTLIKYLNKYVTDGKLEYVIATHAHEDHIAGFVGLSGSNGIFDEYECETIIDFNLTNYGMTDSNGNDTLYAEYVKKRDAEVEEGAVRYSALDCYNNANGAQRKYNLTADGSITLEILYQQYYEKEYKSSENNYSVCCLIRQGDNSYLFTGDLENGGEKSLVENNELPEVTLFKAGHHGSNTSTTSRLLQVIKPQYIMVCCCAGNVQYTQNLANTFPYQETIDRIAPYTDNVYVTTMGIIELDNPDAEWNSSTNRWRNKGFTSMNGNIVFNCVNGEISLSFSNNGLKLKDTEWFKKFRTYPEAWKN